MAKHNGRHSSPQRRQTASDSDRSTHWAAKRPRARLALCSYLPTCDSRVLAGSAPCQPYFPVNTTWFCSWKVLSILSKVHSFCRGFIAHRQSKNSFCLGVGGGGGGGGGGGVYLESCTREARFLTRWDQHAVAGGGVYLESYTREARFLTRWDQHAVARLCVEWASPLAKDF